MDEELRYTLLFLSGVVCGIGLAAALWARVTKWVYRDFVWPPRDLKEDDDEGA